MESLLHPLPIWPEWLSQSQFRPWLSLAYTWVSLTRVIFDLQTLGGFPQTSLGLHFSNPKLVFVHGAPAEKVLFSSPHLPLGIHRRELGASLSMYLFGSICGSIHEPFLQGRSTRM